MMFGPTKIIPVVFFSLWATPLLAGALESESLGSGRMRACERVGGLEQGPCSHLKLDPQHPAWAPESMDES